MYIYIYDEEDVPEEVYMREALRKEILDMIMVKEISYDMIRYDSRREYFSYDICA